MTHKVQISSFIASDGKEIASYYWRAHGTARATLQIVHGMGEHSLCYDHFAGYLAQCGFAVYSSDHRGHGRTVSATDTFMYFSKSGGWQQVCGDIEQFGFAIEGEHLDVPHFIFGHSMGSFLTRALISTSSLSFAGVILCGTAGSLGWLIYSLGIAIARIEKLRLGEYSSSLLLTNLAFGDYNKSYSNQQTWIDWLSRDTQHIDLCLADPLRNHPVTTSFYLDLMQLVRFVQSEKCYRGWSKKVPTLLIAGDDDPVGNYGKGPMQVYKKLKKHGVEDVSLHIFGNARHELINEVNKDEVYSSLLQWFENCLM